MPKNKFSDEIVIRFPMTKGEGDYPTNDDMTEEEMKNPRSICTFMLDLDYGQFEDEMIPVELKTITFLYDGVSDYSTTDKDGKDETDGLSWVYDEEYFKGYPAPIIKFTFSEPVNVDQFQRLVWSSCVNLCSAKQKKNGSNGFYFQDENGWTSVLKKSEEKNWETHFKKMGIYSGKSFEYCEDKTSFLLNF